MPVVIGNYRQLIRLERPDPESGTEYIRVDEHVRAQITFNIQELPERHEPGRAYTAVGPYSVRTRYREDVRAEWRIVDEVSGKTLQVLSYGDRTGRREELWMVCQETQ